MAAAVGVVEGAEELADRAEGRDVPGADPLPGAPVRLALARDHGQRPVPGVRPGGRVRAVRVGGGRAGRRRPLMARRRARQGPDLGALRAVRAARRGGRRLSPGGPAGGAAVAGHPFVGPADEPVAAGDDESGRGEGDLAQLGVGAGVLAP